MSADFNIITKDPGKLSVASCNEYFRKNGLRIEVIPEWVPLEHSGFLPFRLSGDLLSNDNKDKEYISGFEYLINTYEPVEFNPKERNFNQSWWRDKLLTYFYNRAVTGCTHSILLSCGCMDSFEILLTFMFGSYVCQRCGGVFEDLQTGMFYDSYKAIEIEIGAMINVLRKNYIEHRVMAQPFEGWLK